MKLDVLLEYKRRIGILKDYEEDFNRLEAKASIQGATSLIQLTSLADELEEHIKDALNLAKDPFGDALVDNLIQSGQNVGSAFQVMMYEPSEIAFDGRDVLNLPLLSQLSERIFRMVTAVKTVQGVGMPQALVQLDRFVYIIIRKAMEVFNCFTENDPFGKPWEPMSGIPTDAEGLITFTILEKQKYYTEEEREQIRQDNERREQAQKDALEKANKEEKALAYVEEMKKAMGKDYVYDSFDDPDLILEVFPLFKSIFKTDTGWSFADRFENGYEFLIGDKIKATEGTFAKLAWLLTDASQYTVVFKCPEIYCSLTNKESTSTLSVGTMIRLAFE